ncbi:hypothetical protein HN51_039832 [Arachis hypogaea]|nr:uncharacterized protein DS421_16g537520 [Arachis hypogaea]
MNLCTCRDFLWEEDTMDLPMMIETCSKEEEGGGLPIWDCGSSLYDSYELVSLAYTIDRHMMLHPYLTEPNLIFDHSPEPRLTATRGGASLLATLNKLLVKGTFKNKKNRKNKSNQHRKKMTGTRNKNKLMKKCISFSSYESC